MEQVIIQDCGCIALPESIATALALRRGMVLDVALTEARDAILVTPRCGNSLPNEDVSSRTIAASSCVILPPSR
jgi:hypothetical protein